MKSKLKFIIPIVIVVLGGAYKFVLAKPSADAGPKPKVHGEVYVLPKDFLINLKGGQFAKLGVGLIFAEGHSAAPAAGHGAAPSEPPEGYGVLPQEALVRSIITDTLTDVSAAELTSKEGRERLTKKILKRLEKQTDVHAEELLITDLAVQ